MKMQFRRVVAVAALLVVSVAAVGADAAGRRRDVRTRSSATRSRAIRPGSTRFRTAADATQRRVGTAPAGRPIRELRLTEVVAARAREEPRHRGRAAESAARRSADCRACKNQYLPVATSTIGQRDQVPAAARPAARRSARVDRDHDLQRRRHAEHRRGTAATSRCTFNNNRAGLVEHVRHFNPTFTTGLTVDVHAAAAARALHRPARGSSCRSRRSTARSPKRTCARP